MKRPLSDIDEKHIAWLRENNSLTVQAAATQLNITYYQCAKLIKLGGITMQRKYKDLSAEQLRWKEFIAENKGMATADAAKKLGVDYHTLRSFCQVQKIKVELKRGYSRHEKMESMGKFFKVEAMENWLI